MNMNLWVKNMHYIVEEREYLITIIIMILWRNKMCKRLFTKNLTSIPLFWVDFTYKLYKKKGKEGSCMVKIHPNLANDEFIKKTLNELIDYIRDNYNMEDM